MLCANLLISVAPVLAASGPANAARAVSASESPLNRAVLQLLEKAEAAANQHQYDVAAQNYEKALAQIDADRQPLARASVLNLAGRVLLQAEEFPRAEAKFRESQGLQTRHLKAEDLRVAEANLQLAFALSVQEKTAGIEPLIEQARRVLDSRFRSTRDPQVIHDRALLGAILALKGEYALAKTYLSEALPVLMKLPNGFGFPNVPQIRYFLAISLYKLRELAPAKRHATRALAEWQGPDNNLTAYGLHDLLRAIYRDSGDDKNAEVQERAVEQIAQHLSPSARAGTPRRQAQRAQELLDHQEYASAEHEFAQLAESFERLRGPNDLLVAQALYGLGQALRAQSKFTASEAPLLKSRRIYQGLQPAEELGLARVSYELGILYLQTLQWTKAQSAFQDALKLSELRLDPHHAALPDILGRLGSLAILQREWSQAENYARRALKLRMEVNSAPRDIVSCLSVLAAALNHQGRFIEAGKRAEQIVQIYSQQKLSPDSTLAGAEGLLGEMAHRSGNLAQAARHFRRATDLFGASGDYRGNWTAFSLALVQAERREFIEAGERVARLQRQWAANSASDRVYAAALRASIARQLQRKAEESDSEVEVASLCRPPQDALTQNACQMVSAFGWLSSVPRSKPSSDLWLARSAAMGRVQDGEALRGT